MKKILFIREFIKHFKETGSLVPSSKYLTKGMVDEIEFTGEKIIVELGPGTGVFTREIIKRKKKTDILIIIELNKSFYDSLKKQLPKDDKTIILVNGCASKLVNILENLNVKKIDYVISGLPFLNFKENERDAIFQEIFKLLNGKFILFQYTKKVKNHIEKYFKIDKIKRVAFNFPPAYVYICTSNK
ncbi:class I SAM-dependent methyltransferase [Cetobacterium ceti]